MSFDEVNVYPIPAALYLIKNLLQVGELYLLKLLLDLNYEHHDQIALSFFSTVLHLCLCRCSCLSDFEEPKYYQHWCLVPNHSKEEVRS